MRAVDGCFILACAVEGPMPQTETVVRQALKEKVKPVLFINKVDRLINELKVTPEDMLKRFEETIIKVNKLIRQFAPEEIKKDMASQRYGWNCCIRFSLPQLGNYHSIHEEVWCIHD